MRTLLRNSCLVTVFLALLAAETFALDYFVSIDGADTNTGDRQHPFATIGRGVTAMRAGDRLVVTPGTYAESVVITQAGAPGAPITVRGLPGTVLVNPEPGTSRSAIDVRAGAAHITVLGFEITGGFAESVFVRAGAHDIVLARLDIHHNRAGIWIGGAQRVAVSDTVVHHNERSGIRIFAGATDVSITDVRAEFQDDGMGCAGDADGFSVDGTVGRLELVRVQANDNSEDGLDVAASGVEMREVTAQRNACSGIKLGGGGYLQNLLITGSRIGLNISGSSTTLLNSTLLDNGIGIRALGHGDHIGMQNCIVSGAGKALHLDSEVVLREHHNIFYRPDADSRLLVRTIPGGELLYSGDDVNSGRWRLASGGQGDGTIAVDPQLDGFGRPLGPRGPSIDTGIATGSPAIDHDGAPRPMGRTFDRGAFEVEPLAATATVSRVHVRETGNGTGELRLVMTVLLPIDLPLDISTETVRLTVRGNAGTVTTAEIDDANSSGHAAGGQRRRVRFRRAGDQRINVTLRQTGDLVRVSLRAAGVNVAALQSDDLWVDLVAGDVVATAHATLLE